MTESKDELARMLGEDELRDAVLLVSQINTQDYHDSGTICAHVIGAQIKAILTIGHISKAQGQNLRYISYFLLTGAGKQAGPATSPESCRGDREVGFAKAEWSQVVHSGGILLKLAISIKTCLHLSLSLSYCFLWTGDLRDNRGGSDRGAGVA